MTISSSTVAARYQAVYAQMNDENDIKSDSWFAEQMGKIWADTVPDQTITLDSITATAGGSPVVLETGNSTSS